MLNEWEKKIFLILLILFFAGVTLGFCIGCSVESEITETINALN